MHAPSPMPIRVAVAHPLPLIAAGVVHTLSQAPGIAACALAAGAPPERAHDIVITDPGTALRLAAESGAAGRRGKLAVIADTGREQDVHEALAAGVQGYLLLQSSPAEVIHCVRALSAGSVYLSAAAAHAVDDGRSSEALTAREAEVLALLAEGRCNKALARQLGIGLCTVKSHVRAVLHKLGAANRTQAVSVALHRGLLAAPAPGGLQLPHGPTPPILPG